MKPKVIVDYIREPFVFAPGNVRVNLDYDIKTGKDNMDFLNPKNEMISVQNNPIILEIKWDEYLPDIQQNASQRESENRKVQPSNMMPSMNMQNQTEKGDSDTQQRQTDIRRDDVSNTRQEYKELIVYVGLLFVSIIGYHCMTERNIQRIKITNVNKDLKSFDNMWVNSLHYFVL